MNFSHWWYAKKSMSRFHSVFTGLRELCCSATQPLLLSLSLNRFINRTSSNSIRWLNETRFVAFLNFKEAKKHTQKSVSAASVPFWSNTFVHLWNWVISTVPEAHTLGPVYPDRPSPSPSLRWLSMSQHDCDPCRYEPTHPSADKRWTTKMCEVKMEKPTTPRHSVLINIWIF